MRILQLTPRLPYPPTDGGRIVMLQIARALQRAGASVHVVSLNPRKQPADLEAARRALAPIPIDAVDADTSANLRAMFRGLRTGIPPFVARFLDATFRRHLRALLQTDPFDVVQIESPFMLPYLPVIRENSSAAVVLRSHNIEFRVWEQLAAHEQSVMQRMVLRVIAQSVRRFELAHLDACDAVVPITQEDADDFRALGCTLPIHVLPAGVDSGGQATSPVLTGIDEGACPPTVAFLASLDYRPNQEAAIWIAEELLPRLEPRVEVHIAGSRAPRRLRARLTAAGVMFEGDIAEARSFLQPMSVVIAPILSGGGMRIKILEAMAWGKAVVATTLAASSLGVRHGENILLADDADSFAEAVSLLLREPARAQAIGAAARAFVEARYSLNVLARDLLAFYEELIRDAHRPLPDKEADTLASNSRRSSSSDHPHM